MSESVVVRGSRSIRLRFRRTLQERPRVINALGLLLLIAHATLTYVTPLPNVWSGLLQNQDLARDLYTTVAGAGALLAGFAGVVVIFGLSGNSERFRRFRKRAGASLRRTWTSVSSAGFWAMGLGFCSLLLSAGNLDEVAVWVLEMSLFLLAHSSLRLIWILNILVSIVSVEDEIADQAARTREADSLPFMRKQQATGK